MPNSNYYISLHVATSRVKQPLMGQEKKNERLLSKADGTLGLHIKLQQLLNLCYIKAFPLAVDSI